MGVDGTAEAEGFLRWWAGHVEQTLGSPDARRSGARPEDRPWLARFLELAPARFSTAVLDDPGCNLNMWNLHRRTLHATSDGVLVNGRWPLRFLNLPGFEPDRPYQLNPRASRARVSRSPVLHELCERYASELRQNGWRDTDHRGEVGRRLDDGLVYDDSLRALYASALALGEPLENLFSEQGTRAFIAWLQGPAPRGSASGINRYVFHRVARERPDVLWTYPDLDGADGKEYVAWCWAFGRDELAIPDRFMPPRPGHDSPGGAVESVRARRTGGARDARACPAPALRRPRAASEDGLTVRLTGYLGHTLGLGAAARGYVRGPQRGRRPREHGERAAAPPDAAAELAATYGRHGFEDLVRAGTPQLRDHRRQRR